MTSESVFGFRTTVRNERTEVTDILPGSPAAAALTIDDELVAVNGRRVEMNLHSLLSTRPDQQYEVSVFRQGRLLTVLLSGQAGQRYWQQPTIEKLSTATPEQQVSFRGWLKQEF